MDSATTTTDTDTDTATATATTPAGEVITLKHPFTSATGERVYQLTLRRGTRKDMKAAAKFSDDAVDQETFLFASLTGKTMEDIEALDLADNKTVTDRFREMVG